MMIPKLDEYKERWDFTSDSAIKPGLASMEAALEKLGNPEKALKVIHISGTNGKGSTVQLMEAILRAHHYSVGSFTSPAIKDLHDQICYNGHPATSQMVDTAFQQMKEAGLSGQLTDFELLTVVSFLILKELKPDYMLIETGMGGLLDSTNVVTPIVSVITTIAIDHTQFLGKTLAEIAHHKAGIIKEEVPVVTGRLPIEAQTVVKNIARKNKASFKMYGDDFYIEEKPMEVFKGTETIVLCERKMKGNHQRMNTAVAIETLLNAGIELVVDQVQIALANTQLAHRFEEVLPNVFLDGAHNPAAARALKETIETEFPGKKVDFIMGMLKTKDLKGSLDELLPVAASFTFITFDHSDAASGDALMQICHHDNKKVIQVVDGTITFDKNDSATKVIAGSLYLLIDLKFVIED